LVLNDHASYFDGQFAAGLVVIALKRCDSLLQEALQRSRLHVGHGLKHSRQGGRRA
jgi:hypothetical protein